VSVPTWLRILLPAVLIGIWLTLGGLGGPYFGKVEEVSEIDLSAFLPKSAEATKVNEQISKFRNDKTFPAIAVFESKNDLTEAQIDTIIKIGQKFESVEGASDSVAPPVVSDDKNAALVVAPVQSDEKLGTTIAELRSIINKNTPDNVTSKLTGPAGFSADLTKAFAGIDGLLLLTALAVVLVILVIVYRSVILPIAVLLTSILALSASILVVWMLAKKGIVQLNGQVQGILFILVIGAATDYSLLYVSRYREALYSMKSKYDATLAAFRGSFEPILASGGTVIVGLLCLLLSDLASNKALGPVGSIGIAFSMLSALTFLPAVLYALGRISFWPVKPRADKKSAAEHKMKLERGMWHKLGEFIKVRQRPVWVVTTLVLLIAAGFVTQLRATGVSQSDLILGYSEAREGQTILNKHFPDGSGSPALVLVGSDNYDDIVKSLESDPGIESVSVIASGVDAGFKPLGKEETRIKDEIRKTVQTEYDQKMSELDRQIFQIETVAEPEAAAFAREKAVMNIPSVEDIVEGAYPFEDAVAKEVDGSVMLQVTLANAPDSSEAKDTIVRIRETVRSVDQSALVGGTTAVQLDTNTASIRDRQVIIPVVLAAITIILMVLLRSIIAPILLLLSTIISFGAALGIAAFLFNNVLNFPGADPSVILYAFVFLVALGIDYNIFLMTRVREEALKIGTERGVIKGLVVTGGVITSAGIVLAATFAALGVIPILFLFQLAFIVAFGVLLDTFVVRSLLVPALIKDIGPFVWWPSKLRHKK
jgi:RND superfamily putative drug exporter